LEYAGEERNNCQDAGSDRAVIAAAWIGY
jgi:hypothetical protein